MKPSNTLKVCVAGLKIHRYDVRECIAKVASLGVGGVVRLRLISTRGGVVLVNGPSWLDSAPRSQEEWREF